MIQEKEKDKLDGETYGIAPGKVLTAAGEFESGKLIRIKGDRIESVIEGKKSDSPNEIEILRAPNKTLIPGLIDAHVHTYSDGEEGREDYPARATTGYLALRSFINARKDLRAGFTAVRDCSSRRYVDVSLKKAIEEDGLRGPRMIISGHGLSMTGGHGDVSGFPNADIKEDLAVCDSPGGARKEARKQIKRGADFIKLHATGGSFGNGSKPGAQQLSEEEMRAAVEVAHRAGKKVAAHAMGTEGMEAAVRAGVDSIEHGFWLTEKVADLMAEKGTTLVPTLTPLYRNATRGGGFDDEKKEEEFKSRAEEIRESHLRSFQLACDKGLTIACGSDSGGGPFLRHGENGVELELMEEAGMGTLEVLISATRINSRLLGLEEEMGTIEEGKLANLLLVQGDPSEDISLLRDESSLKVIKQGDFVR